MPNVSMQTEQSTPMERTLTPTWLRQQNAGQVALCPSPASSQDTYVQRERSHSPKGSRNTSTDSLTASVSSLGSIHNISARGIATPTGKRRGHGTPVSLRFDNITVVTAPPGGLPTLPARPKMVDMGTQTDAVPPAPVPVSYGSPGLWSRLKKWIGPGSNFWSICTSVTMFVLDRIAIGVKVF